jgi:hypothetical protein
MSEMIWRIGIDAGEARKAGAAFKQAAGSPSGSAGGSIGGKKKKEDGGAFKGGFMGAILGNLLSSVKALFDPLSAIASLLVMALFPIFKPFLILFLKIGLLLYKWLSAAVSGYTSLTGGNKTDGSVKTGGEIGGAVVGGVLGASVAGPVGAVIGATVGAAVGALLPNALKGLQNLWTIATAWADKLMSIFGIDMDNVRRAVVTFIYQTLPDFFTKTIPEWFSNCMRALGNIGQWMWNTLVDTFMATWSVLKDMGKWFWDTLVNIFTITWNILKNIGQWMWDTLVKIFTTAWQVLTGVGQWIWDTLVDIFASAFNVLRGIGDWIWNKLTSMFGGDDSSSDNNVGDAIITPNGDIIRTSPSDYLIATKNPSSFGGGSGGMSNINVSINGGLITEDVAKKIGQIILKEVKRSGGY